MKITKTFTIIALLCISIVVIGCAKPSPIPIPLVPQITGSWEMVSIENVPVDKYFVPLQADYTDTETKIAQNDFVFFPNGTWYWTLDLKITARLKDGSGLAYLPEVAMAARGQYTYSNMALVFVLEKLDAQLTPLIFGHQLV